MTSTMKLDKYGFHKPVWPMACPPIHSQADVLSVAVGNTHLTWTVHGTYEQDFIPGMFWRTAAITDSDADSIDGDDAKPPTSRNKTLNAFLAESASERLFGAADFTISSAAQFRYTQKRIPYIYIYVISTNPEHASSLVSLFQGIPCILYCLSGEDFVQIPSFSLVANESSKNTPPPLTMYTGIGVDRVANIVGAKALFPKAKHLIVIDGGTALTYTTIVRVPYSDDTNADKTSYRLQMGGGIGPGLQMKFRSLYDYTADVPFVESSYINKLLHDCRETKKPLPLFTSSSVPTSKNEELRDDNDGSVTSKSIVGCVMTETALLLCSIIHMWLTIPHNSEQSNGNKTNNNYLSPNVDLLTMPVVVLTGGDCDIFKSLLQPYHSYICSTNDANVELLNCALVDDGSMSTLVQPSRQDVASAIAATAAGSTSNDKKFLIRCERRLQNYAVSHVLSRHCAASIPTATTKSSDNDVDVELLRNQLLGLRIARQNSKNKSYVLGTIVALQRGVQLDDDRYIVMYDGDKKMHPLKIREVYDSLQLFLDAPEKIRTRDEKVRIGLVCRRKDVEEGIAALRKTSPEIQKLLESQRPVPEESDAPELTVENFNETMVTLKRKSMANAPKTSKRFAATNPEMYEKLRIAKFFQIGENGEDNMVLFFGTVTKYVHEQKWWHVEYDDGDNEDMSVNELITHLELYEENKSSDTNN